MNPLNRRSPALDLFRCLGLLCIASMHFFGYSGYYTKYIAGGQMMVLTVMRSFFKSTIAIFLILTGYLMNRKKLSRSYYGKLIKTLVIYVMACTLCYYYRYFFHSTTEASGSVWDLISEIFNYTAISYSWYIRMYIGLFLLIPFLNVMYHGLDTQRSKLALVLTLLTLTAVPQVTNILTYSPGNGLYLSNHSFQQIFPSWWTEFYPVTYYILGAYLQEYPLPLKKWPSIGITLGFVLLNGGINIYMSRGDIFSFGPWQEDGSLLTAIQSVLVLHTLTQLDYSRWKDWQCRLAATLSDLTLGAFLVSWIYDDYFYPLLLQAQPTTAHCLKNYPMMVAGNLVFSLTLSWFLNLVYAGLCAVVRLLPGRVTKAPENLQ